MHLIRDSTLGSAARRGEVLETVNALLGPTRGQPGCLACHAYLDIDSEEGLLLIEKWRSQEHTQKHIASEDFKKVLAWIDLSAKEPEFSVHAIAATMNLNDIADAFVATEQH